MKILVASHGYPPTHSDGAERRAERSARALHALGHNVSVLTVERVDCPEPRRETTRQDGITVHRLSYDVSKGDRWLNLYDHPFVGQAGRDVLREHPVDVVHIISGYLLGGQIVDAAREAGARVVITLTEFWFLCARLNLMRRTGELCDGPGDEKCARCLLEDRRRNRLPAQHMPRLANAMWSLTRSLPSTRAAVAAMARRRRVLQAALEAADLVICPSQFILDTFTRAGFDTSAFRFMRQGVEAPGPPLAAATDSPTLRLGYVGQLKPHKGVDLAVNAVKRLVDEGRPVTLDVWGGDSDAPDYVRQLRQLAADSTAIRWRGRLNGPSIWEALRSIDALVVPSRWYENSPNVILEAFAVGVAVVATDLGGMAELVEPGVSGLLFDLNDLEGLCSQLRRLVTDRPLLTWLRNHSGAVRPVSDEIGEIVGAYAGLLGRTHGDLA